MSDVLGIGIDIVSTERVAAVLRRHPARFLRKVLHPREYRGYDKSRYPARFLARRFAAKEAVVKALGLGFTGGAYACRIRIDHDSLGKPEVILPRDLLPCSHGRYRTLLSVSDEHRYAAAQAIVLLQEE